MRTDLSRRLEADCEKRMKKCILLKCLSVTMTFVRLLKATKDGRRVLSLCRLKLRYFSANYESNFSIR